MVSLGMHPWVPGAKKDVLCSNTDAKKLYVRIYIYRNIYFWTLISYCKSEIVCNHLTYAKQLWLINQFAYIPGIWKGLGRTVWFSICNKKEVRHEYVFAEKICRLSLFHFYWWTFLWRCLIDFMMNHNKQLFSFFVNCPMLLQDHLDELNGQRWSNSINTWANLTETTCLFTNLNFVVEILDY